MGHIILKDISKLYDDGIGHQRMVLDGVSLEMRHGDFVAVTGVSGSGKTTLLNIMGTLLAPDKGSYLLDGETINGMEDEALRKLRNQSIGFVFQDHRLLPQLTAWQNILLPVLASRKKPSEDDLTWARQLTEMLNIGHVTHQMPSTLSGGEKSRVALCRALVMQPHLLLADEPTGQLDKFHAHEVGELLRKVNLQLGMTIVVVTHDFELASVAPTIYELANGKLTLQSTT